MEAKEKTKRLDSGLQTMHRIFNFSAGPATLPEPVLERAREELLDWHGTGMSIMEMSHRSKEFIAVAEEAEADLRELLQIPKNYKVLFLQGGGRSQFAMVPMNLLRNKHSADYVNTGLWSKYAIGEAKRYCTVNVVYDAEENQYTKIIPQNKWKLNPDAAYLHYVDNETVHGLEFNFVPDVNKNVPLVSDMSSNILSRPIDVNKFAVIYAGAQKNVGPSGLTLAIVREDMLGHALPFTPTMFDYKAHADAGSMYNTPPTFAWYLAGLAFKWLRGCGGVEAIAKINERKAKKLYQCIDESSLYVNPIAPEVRSNMNVVFKLSDEQLNEAFIKEAKKAGIVNIKGHTALGGMRASIYNAMPEAGVDALIEFMKEFERKLA